MTKKIDQAVNILKKGGVILYPTEGVYGLGCDPFNENAVTRVLNIKKRKVEQGLILIAAFWDQVADLVDASLEDFSDSATKLGLPTTWVLPATKKVPDWIKGRFDNVAIRVTQHADSKNICKGFGGPIVSTSANLKGKSPPENIELVNKEIIDAVDCVVEGKVGKLGKPTQVCNVQTGQILRM